LRQIDPLVQHRRGSAVSSVSLDPATAFEHGTKHVHGPW
jgi:hypothetical protein